MAGRVGGRVVSRVGVGVTGWVMGRVGCGRARWEGVGMNFHTALKGAGCRDEPS